MTPELIAILAVGITLAGLMVAIWRDARAHTDQGLAQVRAEVRDVSGGLRDLRSEFHADFQSHRQELRADIENSRQELRADMQSHREELRADMQSFREEVRADIQSVRDEVRADLAQVKSEVGGLRKDVQSLSERTSRVEGVIEGVFSGRDRRNDAA